MTKRNMHIAAKADTDDWLMPPWPVFDENDIAAVTQVLQSGKVNYWTGEIANRFEMEFAKRFGARYAVALANGTVALELALRALGIGPGDEVITTCRTFIASASAVVMCGATPVLADVDPDSQNITADAVAGLLTPRTRAIIVVHLAGRPCEMDPIMALARKHSLKVIEDCAQAHGATYRGLPVGSIGDVGTFSFCQDKIMTTGGEGGMLITNDEALWERAWAYKDHGRNYAAAHTRNKNPGFQWLYDTFGTNWRMTEMQAALGCMALKKLDEWLRIRRRNAGLLTEALQGLPVLRLPQPPPHMEHAYYKYYGFLCPDHLQAAWNRHRILQAFEELGVPGLTGTCGEIYLEKAFKDAGLGPLERLPNARHLNDTSLMFLVHPTLKSEDITMMAERIKKVLTKACR
ncbi:aminotransferase, AHBA_syn family [Syntrophotalea carbinolica DSM 2380]|uniref:Aminotransferase, AHBA_syn family n=1 Tax=Syntrophotalea carbinolica (strain DSM 2380 / NBRC 103641 / GraBd1) TaxID=338963 RepID=Q3A4D1_SYNC1|nr:DegT/DnrJ/EryC1/StrS aminotransferase family protein [Syntrophotalea carbinolica]ABA88776.1 aminotransferase, AHBA_syn family [Syntrophotalea carbinolica DSM 2380]